MNETVINQSPETENKRGIHDELSEKLGGYNASPTSLIDHLQKNTEDLHAIAPQTAQAVQSTAATAAQFLHQKLPSNGITNQPLSSEYKPSSTEVGKWHKYYSAINDPVSILHHVASGTITPESLEAVKTVYPKMLEQMQKSVMDEMTKAVGSGKQIPYKTKMALSLFLGQDMVNSLNPTSMLANQNALATATQQKSQQEQMSKKGSANQKNLGKIDKANQLLTDAQASAQRDGRA